MRNDALTIVLGRLPTAKVTRDGWMARCPAHQDSMPSLSLDEGENGRVLLHCHAGCSTDAIVAALGLTLADLMPSTGGRPQRLVVATYRYHDESGAHLYDVIRYEPKDFRQRRADGVWKMDGVPRVVYRLPQLAGHEGVFIVEGEKDVDALIAAGVPATCNPGGAGKWRPEYARQLVTMGITRVCVLPDHDDPGRAHADAVAQSCQAAGLAVRMLALPDLPPKGDVSDWLKAGGTKAQLAALAKSAPSWTPTKTDAAPPRVTLTELGALLAEPDDAVEWVVEDRFAYGSVNLLAGRPKAGKSTLARALALAVARGETWLGSRCRHGRVVYVALEDKRSEVKRHLRAMGATGTEPIRFLIQQAPRTLLADLAALIEGGDTIDLLIVDTAQRLLAVKDANDYALVTTAFEPLLAMARTHGTCIVLLHHAGKADRAGIEQILGSTAWAGSVDNVLLLNRTDRYRVLSSTQRIGRDLPETILQMDDTTGDVHLAGSRYLAELQTIVDSYVDALKSGPSDLTQDYLLRSVMGRPGPKKKALDMLAGDPRAERLGAGVKGNPYRYRLRQEAASAQKDAPNSGSMVPPKGWEPAFFNRVSPLPAATDSSSRDSAGSDQGDHERI